MQLPKVYEPSQYESDIYALWEKSGAFAPKNRGGEGSYSMVMPPPNANANIHIGTAITLDLEDIAVRYHRLRGKAALYVPGADHAGFETQAVFEKHLAKQGKSRFDYSREELYQLVWDFVAENKSNYETQFRKLGVSADWSRYTFTLDDKIVKRAYATFKKMWDDGLIYRGERLVNFCTFHGTAFADIEVVHKEEQGHLWHINYPLVDGSDSITVATTRPETMLGDTAVAVHPDDKRFAQYIGKTVTLPLTHREIPIIADQMVATDFGTGAVKITPAHDPNDFDAGQRHDLPLITVIDHQGKMTHDVPESYRGMSVEDARKKVVADLKEQGFLAKTEDHTHNVGHCYKCGTVIQPLVREQWFVDMKPLAKRAIEALERKEITFYPDSKRLQLISYLQGLRDWNISRQIAWGIPIPAFQNIDDSDDWIYDDRVGEEIIEVSGKTYRRDPDVFDTWFSSSSWPYATLDYPDGEDFKQFYPLSLMETGGEILQPWVSRMIMLGLYVTGDIPFRAVYIHGYVMAEDGSKMSKSLGNVIDPLPVIDKYGSDALRMGLIAGRAPAINRGYDPAKIEGARNFCNKLWNIARFIEDKIGDQADLRLQPDPKTPADHWMLSKLQHTTEVVTEHLDHYRFAEAYDATYHLVWDDFADWYLEASKDQANLSLLAFGIETILKLIHPFAPFVSETIWQTLAWENNPEGEGISILATSQWPTVPAADNTQAATFEQIKAIVTEVRAIMSGLNVTKLSLHHTGDSFLTEHDQLITRLAKLAEVSQASEGRGLNLASTTSKAWLDIDPKTAAHLTNQLQKQIDEHKANIQNLETRLANKAYVSGAPTHLVDQTREQLASTKTTLEKIQTEHDRLANL